MIAIDLPRPIEQKFLSIVREGYDGNLQEAIIAFLQLHEKYAWKEQLRADVASVRTEIEVGGGVQAKDIENAIRAYRANSER